VKKLRRRERSAKRGARRVRVGAVFLLSWDDWGGYDDHVVTLNLEHTPDGVQLAYGPRVPLLMFGGPVTAGIDSRWNGHTLIGKTVLDLLGLPSLGVHRPDPCRPRGHRREAIGIAAGVWNHNQPAAAITHPAIRPTATLTGLSGGRPGDTARWEHPPAAERPARHLTRHEPTRPAHTHRTPERATPPRLADSQ